MRNITLIIGKKRAGKSKWIFNKKDEMLSKGWEKIDAFNEEDYNTTIFVLKSSTGEVAILNSGSDMRCIIEGFGEGLALHKEALHIFTAIRPSNINPYLYAWMMKVLNIQHDDNIKRIEL